MGKLDYEIAQKIQLRPILEIAEKTGLCPEEIYPVGPYTAKVLPTGQSRLNSRPEGKLILVSAMTPTTAGEGKSTTTIGLGMALQRLGHSAVVALREPSLGPCFGIKGGAAGGGWSQVLPMEDINLHFTGDFHAITASNNLLAALIDNHLHHGNRLGLDGRTITWRRVLDMNDRALRKTVIGLGGTTEGVPRETGFDITVASEVMAALCLSDDLMDLRARLARIIIGYTSNGNPVTVAELKAHGAMAALLKHAIHPNLVQTIEGTPALIHGGPFANIAHGCSSVIATRLGLRMGEYCITEAGFGFDLGGEKFLDIKCRSAGLSPRCVVIVGTTRALKLHGGVSADALTQPNREAIIRGLGNLGRHLENVALFGLPSVVAINKFSNDDPGEIEEIVSFCRTKGVPAVVSDVWQHGGAGGEELARAVIEQASRFNGRARLLYADEMSLEEKISRIVNQVYRGKQVVFLPAARKVLEQARKQKLDHLPVCMAKTQYSFSDNPKLLGAPEGFTVEVREARICAGAGFIVVITGQIMTMPGLPLFPASEGIDVDADGNISGLF